MNRVIVLVEGYTEKGFCDRVLVPELAKKNIFLTARIVGSPGKKGGRPFPVVCSELQDLLGRDKQILVTMLFDFYGLKENWPGLKNAKDAPFDLKLPIMVKEIKKAVLKNCDSPDASRFIPYVQMHEIESLLFADPTEMAKFFQKQNPAHKLAKLERKFSQIVLKAGSCEKINSRYDKKPSKRIEKIVSYYKKGERNDAHAHQIISVIGLSTIREKCQNFNDWMTAIEQYAQEQQEANN